MPDHADRDPQPDSWYVVKRHPDDDPRHDFATIEHAFTGLVIGAMVAILAIILFCAAWLWIFQSLPLGG